MPTVLQWVKFLEEKIADQTAYAAPFELRYRNRFVLPFIQKEYAEVYGRDAVADLSMVRPPRTGTAGVVVDAITERITVIGATSKDARAAEVVEAAWEENDLDVMHREATREAMIKGPSFGQVSRAADGERCIVGIETAEQVAVHRESAPPYDVDAALKVMTDEWTGKRRARLWLPGRDLDLVEAERAYPDPERSGIYSRWQVAADVPSGLPYVPVVEFSTSARPLVAPVSFIEPIDSLVDLVDLIEGLMVFAGHFGAVPLRWATGLQIPRDPKDPTKPLTDSEGKPVLGFNPRADHLWVSTTEGTKFGQFTPATLEGFTAWAQHASSRIRAKTSVASTYLSLDLKSHMSAELLKTDEAPMVRRATGIGKRGPIGQATRRLMQMMLDVEDPALARDARVRPRWESPATRIETQDADTFSKIAPHLGAKTTAEHVLGWSPAQAEAGAEEAAHIRSNDPIFGAGKSFMTDGWDDAADAG